MGPGESSQYELATPAGDCRWRQLESDGVYGISLNDVGHGVSGYETTITGHGVSGFSLGRCLASAGAARVW